MKFSKIKTRVINRIMYLFTNVKFYFRRLKYNVKRSDSVKVFIKNGIIKIKSPGITSEVIPLINENKLDSNLNVVNKSDKGLKGISVGLESEFLWNHIFTEEIYNLIYGYYGGEFYLRNNPIIVLNYDDEEHGAQNFHLDWGLRQISIMVSLSDVIEESTHMEYLLGSNSGFYSKHPDRYSKHFKNKVENFIKSNPNSLFKTVGKKDDLFIFDAGNGFHRQVGGSNRIMLHLNFVDNLTFSNWANDWVPSDKKSKDNVWFQEKTSKISEKIKNSSFPEKVFSLILRNKKPNFLVTKILTENYR